MLWKENAIDQCLSGKRCMEWKWCWNSGTQVQILCFEDGRDIVIISWLYLTPCWVNSVKKSWWWSSLHFKSPWMACSQRCKIDPQPGMQLNFLNLGWERNQQEVHHSCLYDSRSLEKGLAGRKANKYFKSLKIKKLYKRGLTWHFVC